MPTSRLRAKIGAIVCDDLFPKLTYRSFSVFKTPIPARGIVRNVMKIRCKTPQYVTGFDCFRPQLEKCAPTLSPAANGNENTTIAPARTHAVEGNSRMCGECSKQINMCIRISPGFATTAKRSDMECECDVIQSAL